jgi:anaerobic ribonucleoside-triphosphate reductase
MPLQLLKYNPGIVKDITQYSAGKNGPYWVDGDLVRFRNGYPTKVGGWEKRCYYCPKCGWQHNIN